jgi:hypothetical protein
VTGGEGVSQLLCPTGECFNAVAIRTLRTSAASDGDGRGAGGDTRDRPAARREHNAADEQADEDA